MSDTGKFFTGLAVVLAIGMALRSAGVLASSPARNNDGFPGGADDTGEATPPERLGNMRTSQAGLEAIKRRESFSATPYADAGGQSIGYGHFIKPGESFTAITEYQGEALLTQDVSTAENAVSSSVAVPLTQAQFDALVSFVYNIGVGAFKSSTLLRLLNAGDYQGAVEQFAVWNKSQGRVNSTLVARRDDEAEQFLSA